MDIIKYITAFVILTSAGMLYDRYKKKFGLDIELNNREKIQKFLLNDDTLLNGKPILWIHNAYDVNSRNWSSFSSRNSNELNQPYLSLCMETIIKTCGDSFNICIIDDNSFEALIPDWSINMDKVPEPIKNHIRMLGLCKVLYYYGGMKIPSSMVVTKNLRGLYNKIISNNCFSFEMINRNKTSNMVNYLPSSKILGCIQNCPTMKKIITFLENKISNDNSNEMDFNGDVDRYLYKLSLSKELFVCNGQYIGIKDVNNKQILIEHLLNNSHVEFYKDLHAIYINNEDILNRIKYQWFSRMSKKQVLNANILISKFILLVLGKHST